MFSQTAPSGGRKLLTSPEEVVRRRWVHFSIGKEPDNEEICPENLRFWISGSAPVEWQLEVMVLITGVVNFMPSHVC